MRSQEEIRARMLELKEIGESYGRSGRLEYYQIRAAWGELEWVLNEELGAHDYPVWGRDR